MGKDNVTIIPMHKEHWADIREIFVEGIRTGNATFETKAPASWEEWEKKYLIEGRLVATLGEEVVGWTTLSAVSSRCAYKGVAEVSIYVGQSFRGQRVGDALLRELVRSSEDSGIWTLQAGIFPENEASVKLHSKYGFRVVGVREKLGKMEERWRDVLLLERRSKVIGS